MKIYFAGSIRGGRQDAELYRKVIAVLKENHQVLTEHVGDLSLSTVEDKGDKAIYEQDTAWMRRLMTRRSISSIARRRRSCRRCWR